MTRIPAQLHTRVAAWVQVKGAGVLGPEGGWAIRFSRAKTVYVNHYSAWLVNADFGLALLKVCGYAPWGMKLRLSGHECAKRELDTRWIGSRRSITALLAVPAGEASENL